METVLQVEGMHCNACVSLIRMEFEEKGWGEKLKDIKLIPGEEKGLVYFSQLNSEELVRVENIINNLENYQVIK